MKKAAIVAVICAYLVLVLVFTYPLVTSLESRVPVDLGDPLFNTWVISWDIHAILTQPANILNGNMFYPYKNVLAYSDLMIVPALLGLPFQLAFGNPVLTYNLVFITLMVFSATSMYLLVKHLTRSSPVGFITGALYAFSAYRFAQAGHLQLMADGFIPLAFLFAHRYIERRSRGDLLLVALAIWLQALSSWYYAIYLLLAMVLFFATMAVYKQLRLDKKTLASFAVTGVLLAALLAPAAWPYWSLNRSMPGFGRTFGETAYFAADLKDYLVSVPENLVIGPVTRPFIRDRERILFPGVATIVFSVVAVISALRRRQKGAPPVMVGVYVCLAAVFALLSLGPYKSLFGLRIPLPFAVLFQYVPGFRAMRVPARLGVMVLFAMVVMAGYGLVVVRDWLRKPGRDSRRVVIAAAAVAAALTYSQVVWTMPLSDPIGSGDSIPGIYRWLARQKSPRVILELPVGEKPTQYLYYSAYHWKRSVNGYSGYSPPTDPDLQKEMKTFPSRRSVLVARAMGADGLLVHHPGTDLARQASKTGGLELEQKIGSDYFYRVTGGRPPVRRGALVLRISGDKPKVNREQVVVSMTVRNVTDDFVSVPPALQPVLATTAGGRLLDRRVSRLPLILGPRETVRIPLVLPPSAAGYRKVRLMFGSPVVANKSLDVALTVE